VKQPVKQLHNSKGCLAFHLSALEATYISKQPPERICLFFTNFPLGNVSQYSTAIYQCHDNSPAILPISLYLRPDVITHKQSAVSMTL